MRQHNRQPDSQSAIYSHRPLLNSKNIFETYIRLSHPIDLCSCFFRFNTLNWLMGPLPSHSLPCSSVWATHRTDFRWHEMLDMPDVSLLRVVPTAKELRWIWKSKTSADLFSHGSFSRQIAALRHILKAPRWALVPHIERHGFKRKVAYHHRLKYLQLSYFMPHTIPWMFLCLHVREQAKIKV